MALGQLKRGGEIPHVKIPKKEGTFVKDKTPEKRKAKRVRIQYDLESYSGETDLMETLYPGSRKSYIHHLVKNANIA